ALTGCATSGTTASTAADPSAAAGSDHAMTHAAARIDSPSPLPSPTLSPQQGSTLGLLFESYLTPHQEGGEEEDTPSTTPEVFRSTAPSKSRADRESAGHRGHGQLRFSKDLSRAFIDVKIEGIDPSTIQMFHIHCGKPGILGPILVDLALATDLQKTFQKGTLSVEIRNEHIVQTATQGHGPVAAFANGCVIASPSLGSLTPVKVTTVAGMAMLALDRELYFNLHTSGQMYFGDIRGQLLPVEEPTTTTETSSPSTP
ncbi:MAG: CHRD domain-containing protein, partial [Polyangiaceae bacterium]